MTKEHSDDRGPGNDKDSVDLFVPAPVRRPYDDRPMDWTIPMDPNAPATPEKPAKAPSVSPTEIAAKRRSLFPQWLTGTQSETGKKSDHHRFRGNVEQLEQILAPATFATYSDAAMHAPDLRGETSHVRDTAMQIRNIFAADTTLNTIDTSITDAIDAVIPKLNDQIQTNQNRDTLAAQLTVITKSVGDLSLSVERTTTALAQAKTVLLQAKENTDKTGAELQTINAALAAIQQREKALIAEIATLNQKLQSVNTLIAKTKAPTKAEQKKMDTLRVDIANTQKKLLTANVRQTPTLQKQLTEYQTALKKLDIWTPMQTEKTSLTNQLQIKNADLATVRTQIKDTTVRRDAASGKYLLAQDLQTRAQADVTQKELDAKSAINACDEKKAEKTTAMNTLSALQTRIAASPLPDYQVQASITDALSGSSITWKPIEGLSAAENIQRLLDGLAESVNPEKIPRTIVDRIQPSVTLSKNSGDSATISYTELPEGYAMTLVNVDNSSIRFGSLPLPAGTKSVPFKLFNIVPSIRTDYGFYTVMIERLSDKTFFNPVRDGKLVITVDRDRNLWFDGGTKYPSGMAYDRARTVPGTAVLKEQFDAMPQDVRITAAELQEYYRFNPNKEQLQINHQGRGEISLQSVAQNMSFTLEQDGTLLYERDRQTKVIGKLPAEFHKTPELLLDLPLSDDGVKELSASTGLSERDIYIARKYVLQYGITGTRMIQNGGGTQALELVDANGNAHIQLNAWFHAGGDPKDLLISPLHTSLVIESLEPGIIRNPQAWIDAGRAVATNVRMSSLLPELPRFLTTPSLEKAAETVKSLGLQMRGGSTFANEAGQGEEYLWSTTYNTWLVVFRNGNIVPEQDFLKWRRNNSYKMQPIASVPEVFSGNLDSLLAVGNRLEDSELMKSLCSEAKSALGAIPGCAADLTQDQDGTVLAVDSAHGKKWRWNQDTCKWVQCLEPIKEMKMITQAIRTDWILETPQVPGFAGFLEDSLSLVNPDIFPEQWELYKLYNAQNFGRVNGDDIAFAHRQAYLTHGETVDAAHAAAGTQRLQSDLRTQTEMGVARIYRDYLRPGLVDLYSWWEKKMAGQPVDESWIPKTPDWVDWKAAKETMGTIFGKLYEARVDLHYQRLNQLERKEAMSREQGEIARQNAPISEAAYQHNLKVVAMAHASDPDLGVSALLAYNVSTGRQSSSQQIADATQISASEVESMLDEETISEAWELEGKWYVRVKTSLLSFQENPDGTYEFSIQGALAGPAVPPQKTSFTPQQFGDWLQGLTGAPMSKLNMTPMESKAAEQLVNLTPQRPEMYMSVNANGALQSKLQNQTLNVIGPEQAQKLTSFADQLKNTFWKVVNTEIPGFSHLENHLANTIDILNLHIASLKEEAALPITTTARKAVIATEIGILMNMKLDIAAVKAVNPSTVGEAAIDAALWLSGGYIARGIGAAGGFMLRTANRVIPIERSMQMLFGTLEKGAPAVDDIIKQMRLAFKNSADEGMTSLSNILSDTRAGIKNVALKTAGTSIDDVLLQMRGQLPEVRKVSWDNFLRTVKNPYDREAYQILMPEGEAIGVKGTSYKTRIVKATTSEAKQFFDKLVRGGTKLVTNEAERITYKMPNGQNITFRWTSEDGSPAINLTYYLGLTLDKIHFYP